MKLISNYHLSCATKHDHTYHEDKEKIMKQKQAVKKAHEERETAAVSVTLDDPRPLKYRNDPEFPTRFWKSIQEYVKKNPGNMMLESGLFVTVREVLW